MELEPAWSDMMRLVQTGSRANLVTAAQVLIVNAFAGQRCHGGSMPLWTHSTRVGLQLERYGADLPTILAGFCHDLLNCTEVTYGQINTLFGAHVAELVAVGTLDASLDAQSAQRGIDTLVHQVERAGFSAVLIQVVVIDDCLKEYHQLLEKQQDEMLYRSGAWLELGRRHCGMAHPAVKALETTLRNISPELGRRGGQ